MESNHDILLNFFPRLRNKHCKSCSCFEQEVTIIAMCNVCTARSINYRLDVIASYRGWNAARSLAKHMRLYGHGTAYPKKKKKQSG